MHGNWRKPPSGFHICRRTAAFLGPLTSVKTDYQSPEVRPANISNACRQIHCSQASKKKLYPRKWSKNWLSSRLTICLLILRKEQYKWESSKPKTEPEQLRNPLIGTTCLAATAPARAIQNWRKDKRMESYTSGAQEQKQGQSLTMEHEKPLVQAEMGNEDSLLTHLKVTPVEF